MNIWLNGKPACSSKGSENWLDGEPAAYIREGVLLINAGTHQISIGSLDDLIVLHADLEVDDSTFNFAIEDSFSVCAKLVPEDITHSLTIDKAKAPAPHLTIEDCEFGVSLENAEPIGVALEAEDLEAGTVLDATDAVPGVFAIADDLAVDFGLDAILVAKKLSLSSPIAHSVKLDSIDFNPLLEVDNIAHGIRLLTNRVLDVDNIEHSFVSENAYATTGLEVDSLSVSETISHPPLIQSQVLSVEEITFSVAIENCKVSWGLYVESLVCVPGLEESPLFIDRLTEVDSLVSEILMSSPKLNTTLIAGSLTLSSSIGELSLTKVRAVIAEISAKARSPSIAGGDTREPECAFTTRKPIIEAEVIR